MINRLVKLHFQPEHVESFQKLFESVQKDIAAFDGCNHIELWQDADNPCLFFTYSIWDTEDHLNAYRDSELFAVIWKTVKSYFQERAEAWSVR